MRLMRFSGFIFIENRQSRIFKSKGCLRIETVEELLYDKKYLEKNNSIYCQFCLWLVIPPGFVSKFQNVRKI